MPRDDQDHQDPQPVLDVNNEDIPDPAAGNIADHRSLACESIPG